MTKEDPIQIKTEICTAVADLLTQAAELPEEINKTTGNQLFLQGITQNIEQCTRAIRSYITQKEEGI